MGMQSLIANAVGAAFGAVGDLRQNVVLTRRTATTYDPSAGAATDTSTTVKCTGIYLPAKSGTSKSIPGSDVSIPASVDSPDAPSVEGKLLIRVSELKDRPRDQDEVTLANGKKYSVESVSLDPAGTVYTLQLSISTK